MESFWVAIRLSMAASSLVTSSHDYRARGIRRAMVVRIDEFAEKHLRCCLNMVAAGFSCGTPDCAPRGTQDTAQTEQSPPNVVSPVIAVSPRAHP